ncbi:hypothetical protein EYF80_047033 [Liparis tanakae]|uniref:Uncharacterized protein n=1 Tax=Liparis tanakae TaxID=230148 RepID=A0A4Z2FPT0_9TELE|nr:hypothetical protein EYF80_047033 [Liparis tanakae]
MEIIFGKDHGFIRVLQQEADGHEGEALLGVGVDRHPPRVTLVHVGPAHAEHAGDTGPTQVNVQDADLRNRLRCSMTSCSVRGHRLQVSSRSLTFLPACLSASASSVVMVLLPTPPFPDRTSTTWRTCDRFPSGTTETGGQFSSSDAGTPMGYVLLV